MASVPKTWSAEIQFAQFHAAATIVQAMAVVVADLRAEGVDDPLREPITLAAVLNDICRNIGTEPPSEIVDALS